MNKILPITKTIYSIVLPKTQLLFNQFRTKKGLEHMYENTWSKSQDAIHLNLKTAYETYIAPRMRLERVGLPYFYPCNGSSEAIREELVYLHTEGKTLVVFEGEYEGYEAIATAIQMPIKKVPRPKKKECLNSLVALWEKEDVFFLSEPSAIDGNAWDMYPDFMRLVKHKGWSVYLDLSYAEYTERTYEVDDEPPAVQGIFWSLSKAFGVYYHRIGGVYLTRENPLLYGNLWFKNLFAIEFGAYLLYHFALGEAAKELKSYQESACKQLQEMGWSVTPSLVGLVGTVQTTTLTGEQKSLLQRHQLEESTRICLSPLIEKQMRGASC
jgi:histidinol-phosphate/aromatic aminotransferase/cobyric acid decarboxylase-like protein